VIPTEREERLRERVVSQILKTGAPATENVQKLGDRHGWSQRRSAQYRLETVPFLVFSLVRETYTAAVIQNTEG
jgi:hypothetical protein